MERSILYNNPIEEIAGNVFLGLDKLKKLQLDNNKMKRIETNTLEGLINLE